MTDATSTTRVYLIRHGETAWNASGRWQGHAPVPLNDTGRAQSAALGRYLAQHDVSFDAFYSSDLLRAIQTAQAVAEPLGLDVIKESRVREIDLGNWQGLTRDEAAAWDPDNWQRYAADWRDVPVPSGESRRAVQVRVRAAFDDLTAQHAGETIALVSHGGTLGMLLESLFGRLERPSLRNTSVTIVERAVEPADDGWTIARLVWTPHLDTSDALGETW